MSLAPGPSRTSFEMQRVPTNAPNELNHSALPHLPPEAHSPQASVIPLHENQDHPNAKLPLDSQHHPIHHPPPPSPAVRGREVEDKKQDDHRTFGIPTYQTPPAYMYSGT